MSVDPDLVARAKNGDVEAMNELLAAVEPRVLRYCRRRLAGYPGGREMAQEVAQDTLLAVAQALPGYRMTNVPFEAFVQIITTNKTADAQRHYGRARERVVEEVPDRPTPSHEDAFIAKLRWAKVLEAMRRCLSPLAQHIVLRRAEGVPADEIGERAGMTGNAVRVAHHRALKALRDELRSS